MNTTVLKLQQRNFLQTDGHQTPDDSLIIYLFELRSSVITKFALPHRQVQRVFHPLLASLPPIVLEVIAMSLCPMALELHVALV
jgi:hypothetical protein